MTADEARERLLEAALHVLSAERGRESAPEYAWELEYAHDHLKARARQFCAALDEAA